MSLVIEELTSEFITAVIGKNPDLILPSKRYISEFLSNKSISISSFNLKELIESKETIDELSKIEGCILERDLQEMITFCKAGDLRLLDSWISNGGVYLSCGKVITFETVRDLLSNNGNIKSKL